MKDLWLFYNQLYSQYIYSEGQKPLGNINRYGWMEIVDTKGLIKKLKEVIDLKRKSILHLENVFEEVATELISFFEDTKIKVIYEENKQTI